MAITTRWNPLRPLDSGNQQLEQGCGIEGGGAMPVKYHEEGACKGKEIRRSVGYQSTGRRGRDGADDLQGRLLEASEQADSRSKAGITRPESMQ